MFIICDSASSPKMDDVLQSVYLILSIPGQFFAKLLS